MIVHGTECQKRVSCQALASPAELGARIQYHAIGLLPDQLDVQVFRNGSQVIGTAGGFVKVNTLTATTPWSTSADPGQSVQVGLRYPFRSALAMLWPGAGRVNFTLTNLGAFSWDTIQF